MADITPNLTKRDCGLPAGCKDLIDVLQGAKGDMKAPHLPGPPVRLNGRIRAPQVEVRDEAGNTLGVLSLLTALDLARSRGVDLVEIDRVVSPPICVLIDYGAFCYRESKRKRS